MRTPIICLLLLLFHIIISPAYALYIGFLPGVAEVDSQAPVHIMVMGDAGELGNQFISAAASKAKRIQALFPGRRIIFIRSNESGNRYDYNKYGIKVTRSDSEKLYGNNLVSLLEKYKQISGIDIFSHSNPHDGARLDSKSHRKRFNHENRGVSDLRDNFTSMAYINLNGCNMGYVQAEKLSSMLGIPVLGAMTSTDFQQLHSDGQWYFNNPGQYPAEGKFLFSSSEVVRMKPLNKRYAGGWGTFSAGLPFYKMFCSSPISENRCSVIMALSLLAFPSSTIVERDSTIDSYKQLVADFLCPTDPVEKVSQECRVALASYEERGKMVYNASFVGKTLKCDHRRCEYSYKCKKIPFVGTFRPKSCRVKAVRNSEPTELIAEYQRYLRGFELLQSMAW
jgi:hypothetical protein